MSGNILNVTQKSHLEDLMERGILSPLDDHRLHIENGYVLVTCGDADQIMNIFMESGRVCATHRGDSRLHMITMNGGPVRLDNLYPLNQIWHSSLAEKYFEIVSSCILKKMETVVLIPHAVCGMENLMARDIDDSLTSVVRTKYLLKSCAKNPDFMNFVLGLMDSQGRLSPDAKDFAHELQLPGKFKVAIFPQFDLGEDGKIMKFLSGRNWKKHVGEACFSGINNPEIVLCTIPDIVR